MTRRGELLLTILVGILLLIGCVGVGDPLDPDCGISECAP